MLFTGLAFVSPLAGFLGGFITAYLTLESKAADLKVMNLLHEWYDLKALIVGGWLIIKALLIFSGMFWLSAFLGLLLVFLARGIHRGLAATIAFWLNLIIILSPLLTIVYLVLAILM